MSEQRIGRLIPASAEPTFAPAVEGFESILFGPDEGDLSGAKEPPFFADLNLDQVVESITAGRDEYDLTTFFYAPLRSVDAVGYRQEVFRDLEQDEVREAVREFGGEMQRVRRYRGLAEKQHYKYERERWFLDAVAIYCDATNLLARRLADLDLMSIGFRGLSHYLTTYTASGRFSSLAAEARSLLDRFARVQYTLRIKGRRVTVGAYNGESDYSVEVEKTFERFRQGQVDKHLFTLPDSGTMDHVEARIVERVARLYPDLFRALDSFSLNHGDFLDRTIGRFDREVQFYLAYIEYTERFASADLRTCYPTVSGDTKEISAQDAFDIALAAKLAGEPSPVIRNDFFLRGPERILVITGPNQGGKTTFARMFGQLHYLASLGLPVPARSAQLFLPDRLFTHFEQEEDIATLHGKLEEELVRIRDVLGQASGASIVILNEIFTSTTLEDAIYLGTEVLKQIIELGLVAVCVTFVDELASLGESTVSMVATVEPDDPAKRTFKIVRRPADGRAYAWAIADKYGLTGDALRGRVAR